MIVVLGGDGRIRQERLGSVAPVCHWKVSSCVVGLGRVYPLALLYYSSRVPLGGFANLVGASGITKFTISQLEYRHNRLPMASTW